MPQPVTLGSGARTPYTTAALINISAMSYGAISRPAVVALGAGAAQAGCWLNTGEGGLSPYHLASGADLVFQIGTAKNGVRDLRGNLCDTQLRAVAAHPQVRMFEIKLSQGAKPGKGGILPGSKVTPEIAAIRGVPIGVDAISPNRHLDVGNTEELLDMIHRVREVTGKPVGFKVVIGAYGWLDELCASGKLITPADVAWALCIGADFVCSARGFMFALGCIQALKCNKNTCPTGITTHNPKLQKALHPPTKAARVAAYVKNSITTTTHGDTA